MLAHQRAHKPPPAATIGLLRGYETNTGVRIAVDISYQEGPLR